MRSLSSFKNILSGIVLQIITIILGIILRKIMLNSLGLEYIGLNSVLSNIVSMLGIVELGIGLAISYSLYEPLARGDFAKVTIIMKLFASFYNVVAFIIFCLGALFFPLLHNFVDSNINKTMVNYAYVLFVIDSVSTYLLAHRRTILIADQKKYLLNNFTVISTIILNVLQGLFLILYKNFIVFILIRIFITLAVNIVTYKYTSKRYPYLSQETNGTLDLSTKNNIIKNIRALFLANISVYLIFGTDSLMISFFLSTVMAGIYSNYSLIVNAIKSLISQVFTGITSSYGNLIILDTKQSIIENFYTQMFLNFWLSSFSSISLIILLNPFIDIWLGEGLQLTALNLILIVTAFYLDTMRSTIESVKSAAGLYSPYSFYKYWIVIEAIIKISVSIVLVKFLNLGLNGIFLGTILSLIFSSCIFPINVYKYVFTKSSSKYYINMLTYTILTIIIGMFVYKITSFIEFKNLYVDFILKIAITAVFSNLSIIILFYKNKNFIKLKNILFLNIGNVLIKLRRRP